MAEPKTTTVDSQVSGTAELRRRFRQEAKHDDIIKDIKKHSFYLKPSDKRRAKQALARKSSRKRLKPEVVEPAGGGFKKYQRFLSTGTPNSSSYVLLLGLATGETQELLVWVEDGLPYRVFDELVLNTALSSEVALQLLDIPSRTLSRRKQEGRFRQAESDRLMRASRIFARALDLFEGNRDSAKKWLIEPQPALSGATPIVIARTEVGALEVERLIGRLEHGVFT